MKKDAAAGEDLYELLTDRTNKFFMVAESTDAAGR